MQSFTIGVAPYKGKHIQVSRYAKISGGVEIKIDHNVTASPWKQLQWVQTVSSNRGYSVLCGIRTRVDPFGVGGGVNTVALPNIPGPCKADDQLPFYWTAADLAAGRGPGLSDSPSVPAPATGRTTTRFVTALTEVTGIDVRHLVSIAWGYDRLATGTVLVAATRPANTAEMVEHFRALRKMYPSYRYS